jgi:hypothetical protein
MFVVMELELMNWKEKLSSLVKGKSLAVDGPEQSVYSAIRDNPDLFKDKKFSVRTHPITLKKRVIRIK